MRIKPWLLTGAVTVAASAALGVIISAHDPGATAPVLFALFWISLVLSLWGVVATVVLVLGMNLAQATWISFVTAAGAVGFIFLWRFGFHDRRLLGGLILATLLVSLLLWWRLRHA